MVLQAFSLLDGKSGSYSAPFFAFNAAVAQRMVAATLAEPNSMLGKFPSDFQLLHVGSFDDGTGVVTGAVPSVVCNVVSLRENSSAS